MAQEEVERVAEAKEEALEAVVREEEAMAAGRRRR